MINVQGILLNFIVDKFLFKEISIFSLYPFLLFNFSLFPLIVRIFFHDKKGTCRDGVNMEKWLSEDNSM